MRLPSARFRRAFAALALFPLAAFAVLGPLVPEEEQRAVELVGLGGVPRQNWLAEAHGWRPAHARSWALVGLRTLLALVVLGVLLWVAHLLRA